MSTPEPTRPVTEDATGERSPRLGAAILSFFLPGLGQLTQDRGDAFIWHLLLFVLSAVVPYGVIIGYLATVSYYVSPREMGPALLLLPLPLLTIIVSVVDAACWKPGRRSYLLKPIKVMAIGFIAVYAAILLFIFLCPIGGAREAARRMQCTNNFKQIGLAFHTYHDKYRSFPPAYTVDADGEPLHSWRVLLLPFMEQEELYSKIRLDEPWDSEYNRQFHAADLSMFQCPGNEIHRMLKKKFPQLLASGNCYYSVVIGEETIFPGAKAMPMSSITDGSANTILTVERMVPVCWMAPSHEITLETALHGANRNLMGIGSTHRGGCNVGLADGSVRYLSEATEPDVLKAALTRAGGETHSEF